MQCCPSSILMTLFDCFVGSNNKAWWSHRSHRRGPDHERRSSRQKWSVPPVFLSLMFDPMSIHFCLMCECVLRSQLWRTFTLLYYYYTVFSMYIQCERTKGCIQELSLRLYPSILHHKLSFSNPYIGTWMKSALWSSACCSHVFCLTWYSLCPACCSDLHPEWLKANFHMCVR